MQAHEELSEARHLQVAPGWRATHTLTAPPRTSSFAEANVFIFFS